MNTNRKEQETAENVESQYFFSLALESLATQQPIEKIIDSSTESEMDRKTKLFMLYLSHYQNLNSSDLMCSWPGCFKVFKHSKSLNVHKRIHLGLKPFVCNLCDAAFTQSSGLRGHLLTHSGRKPYECDFKNCNKSFVSSSKLKDHQRIHFDSPKITCTFEGCSKLFSLKSQLYSHMSVHKKTQELFECKFCEKTFKARGSVYRHVKKEHADCK